MAIVLVLSFCLCLFDSYVSYRRIKKYGRFAEVNMVVRQTITDFGLPTGIAVGFIYNMLLFGAAAYSHWLKVLWFLCGTKFGLTLMQLKSIQMESFAARALIRAEDRKLTGPKVPPSTTLRNADKAR